MCFGRNTDDALPIPLLALPIAVTRNALVAP
jgi:hypothetical protein